MTKQFDGRISIVTGAGSGIGFATRKALPPVAHRHLRRLEGRRRGRASIRSSGGNATGGHARRPRFRRLDGADPRMWSRAMARSISSSTMPGSRCRGDTAADVSRRCGTASSTSMPRASARHAVRPAGMVAASAARSERRLDRGPHRSARPAAYCASKGRCSRSPPSRRAYAPYNIQTYSVSPARQ